MYSTPLSEQKISYSLNYLLTKVQEGFISKHESGAYVTISYYTKNLWRPPSVISSRLLLCNFKFFTTKTGLTLKRHFNCLGCRSPSDIPQVWEIWQRLIRVTWECPVMSEYIATANVLVRQNCPERGYITVVASHFKFWIIHICKARANVRAIKHNKIRWHEPQGHLPS